jgi:hypothetical protein
MSHLRLFSAFSIRSLYSQHTPFAMRCDAMRNGRQLAAQDDSFAYSALDGTFPIMIHGCREEEMECIFHVTHLEDEMSRLME